MQMQLGWIDFSKNDRNKVLSVLDMLSEAGTLDELGIAPIRDGFASLFFPGTSTNQTRAKYFMIVPYALKDLEHGRETDLNRVLKALDEIEQYCGEILLQNSGDTDGIIGSRSLAMNRWVKRTPSGIYWSGLQKYGIFTKSDWPMSKYVKEMCKLKKTRASLVNLGNRNDNAEEGGCDDIDVGNQLRAQFWKIPTYNSEWKDNLKIKLSAEEGEILKKQIVVTFPDSLMAYILKNRITEIFECKSFKELDGLIQMFPEQIQSDYKLAADFSDFLFVLRTIYNIIVSEGRNADASLEWETLKDSLDDRAAIDLEAIFKRLIELKVYVNVSLRNFLCNSKKLMVAGNLKGMKKEICRRERELKQSRAKTMHPGEFNPDTWFGGGALDYRFGNAKVIMRDIFESGGTSC